MAPLIVGALTSVSKGQFLEAVKSSSGVDDGGIDSITDEQLEDIYWRLYLSGWHLTFLISSIIVFIGVFAFAIWGSGEIQSWAFGDETQILVVDKSKSTEELFKEDSFKVSKIQQKETKNMTTSGVDGDGGRGGGGRGAEGGKQPPHLQLEEEDEVDYEEKAKNMLTKAAYH